MAKVVELPFFGGVDESVDKIFLPTDRLAIAKNCRMTRAGRLEVRPAYTALAATTYSAASMTAYDLANYNGKLVALGDQLSFSRPTDLFEYVSAAGVWRGLAGDDVAATAQRLPRATNVRDIGRVADLSAAVQTAHVATNGTVLCSVAQTTNGRAMIHAFKPDTDQTLLLQNVALNLARVLFAGSVFWIIGINPANDDIVGYQFNPTTGKALVSLTPTILRALAGTTSDLAVAQTGASDFTIAYAFAGDVFAERFNSAGTTQANWTATTDAATAVAVCGNTGGTLISVAWQKSIGNDFALSTFNAAGTLQTGPTALFLGSSGSTIDRLGMVQNGVQVAIVGVADIDWTFGSLAPEFETFHQVITQSTHVSVSLTNYRNSVPQTIPVAVAGGGFLGFDYFYGAVDYFAASNSLGTNQLVNFELRQPQLFKDFGLGPQILTSTAVNAINGSCAIGTKIYWCNLQRTSDTGNATEDSVSFAVTETEMRDSGRRQITQIANELHIAGALPTVYDGQYLVEQGFAERPQIVSLTAAAGGSKTLLGTYKIRVCWAVTDARGNTARSAVSGTAQDVLSIGPETITLTGANGTITVVATAPHSLRTHPFMLNQGGYSVRLEIYSTIAGGGNFFLDKTVRIDPNAVDYGAPITTTLTQSDSALRDNAVLYTQSQTPISHIAPPPYRFSARTRERLGIGGLAVGEQWLQSKLLFPFEPIEFAPHGRPGFAGRANQDITGVAAADTATIIFTAQEISSITGRGPEHDGTGDFDAARAVEAPGGCRDWRSILAGPFGVFYQMTEDTLMLIGPAGDKGVGEVSWVGEPIQTTLAAYPVITGAVHVRNQMICAFSCNNVAGNDGVILIYDLGRRCWFVDTIGAAVAAVSEYLGRLTYISAGVVYLQDASIALGAAAMPQLELQSGAYRYWTAMGWGQPFKVGVLGTFLGACTLELFVRYDDETSFTSMGTQAPTGATYTVGQATPFIFTALRECSRFELRCVVTNATNTGGVRLHSFAIELQGADGLARLPAHAVR